MSDVVEKIIYKQAGGGKKGDKWVKKYRVAKSHKRSSGGTSSSPPVSSPPNSSPPPEDTSMDISNIPFQLSPEARQRAADKYGLKPSDPFANVKVATVDDKTVSDAIRVDTNQRISQGSQTSMPEDLAWTPAGSIKRTQQKQGKSSSGGVTLKDVKKTKSSDLRSRGHRGQKEGSPKPGEELTIVEYKGELNQAQDNITKALQTKTNLYDFGQELIDFNRSKPVEIEGKIYEGNKVEYTVHEFYRQFLYGDGTVDSPVQYNKTLSAKDYDIYLANMGRYYQKESDKIDEITLENISTQLDKAINQAGDWHPDTKVRKIKQKDGTYKYEVDFPFSGADIYYSTRKEIDKRNKNPWSLEGITSRFALALTPENFAGIPATVEYLLGNKEKAHQIEVSAVAGTRNVKDFWSAAGWYLSSPMGTLGLTTATAGVSSIAAPHIGRLSTAYPSAFGVTSKVVGAGMKVGVATYGTYEFTKNVSEGEIGRAFGGATRLGLTYYGMSKASEAGMMMKDPKTGLPRFKVGAYKGQKLYIDRMFDKDAKQVISLLRQGKSADHLMTAWKAGANKGMIDELFMKQSYMALHPPNTTQPEPVWTRIESFFGKSNIRNVLRGQWVKGKIKMIGSAITKTVRGDITGDYDPHFKSIYRRAEAEYFAEALGYNPKDIMDAHYIQKGFVTEFGGISESPYTYPSGGIGSKWTEQFTRISDRTLRLLHPGHVKHISESVNVLKQIYPKGLPEGMGSMQRFEFFASGVKQYPIYASSTIESLYFSPSSTDYIKDIGKSVIKRTMGWKFSKNLAKLNLGTKPISTFTVSQSYLPPTPTWTPSSILSPLQMSAALNPSTTMNPMNFVRMYRTSPRFATTSTSFTLPTRRSPIASTSKSLSNIFSRSFSSSSRSFSRSLSSSVSMPSISISGLSSSSSTSTSSSFSSSLSPSSSYSISASSSSSSSSKSSSSYSSSSSPFFGSGMWLPPRMMGGRGASSWEKYFKKLDYGFRKFDIPDIDKLAKRFKL